MHRYFSIVIRIKEYLLKEGMKEFVGRVYNRQSLTVSLNFAGIK